MQAKHSEKWERTKRHLLRNFLVNPGFQLSPIREEERSSSDSESLPDLIVEPEPNRHDHPPSFYEGLERRMKRLYRELFLGVNSDDASSDVEVNRSIGDTSMTNIDIRKDKEIRNDENLDSDLDVSISISTKEKQVTKSAIVSDDDVNKTEDTISDKPIDTPATYNKDTSTDDSNKSSSEDVSEYLQTNESSSQSNDAETELNKNIEGNDNRRSEIIETKSISEDSIQHCHRISTTIADIHETPRRDSVQFDNGSPVLIPKLLQFGRTVFGSPIVSTFSGRNMNVLKASGEHINHVPTHVTEQSSKQDMATIEPKTNVQKLLTTVDLTSIGINKTIDISIDELINRVPTHITEQTNKQDMTTIEPETNMQRLLTPSDLTSIGTDETMDTELVNTENSGDKSQEINKGDGESTPENDKDNEAAAPQDTAGDDDADCFDFALRKRVFERKARKYVLYSSDEESDDFEPIAHSTDRSIEKMREARGSGGGNVSWRGEEHETSPALAFETNTSADKLEHISSSSDNISSNEEENGTTVEPAIQNIHDDARLDDFWSVSPVEVNFEDLPRSNKRSGPDSSDGSPPIKKKKDASTQKSEEKIRWVNMTKEMFVGQPLVFRLCRCKNHECT